MFEVWLFVNTRIPMLIKIKSLFPYKEEKSEKIEVVKYPMIPTVV